MVAETLTVTEARAAFKASEPSEPLKRSAVGRKLSDMYTAVVSGDEIEGLPFDRDAALFDSSIRTFNVDSGAVRRVLEYIEFDSTTIDCLLGSEDESESDRGSSITLGLRRNGPIFENHTLGVSFGLELNPREGHAFGLNFVDMNGTYRDPDLLNRAKHRINQEFKVGVKKINQKGEEYTAWVFVEDGRGAYDRIGDPNNEEYIKYDAEGAALFLWSVNELMRNGEVELISDSDHSFRRNYSRLKPTSEKTLYPGSDPVKLDAKPVYDSEKDIKNLEDTYAGESRDIPALIKRGDELLAIEQKRLARPQSSV